MADLSFFDATTVQPSSFEPIPSGWYSAIITESSEQENNAHTGSYLKLRLLITEGEHRGRNLFVNLNIRHPNQQAEQIARQDLSAICHATKILHPRDSMDLHNIPMLIKVTVDKDKQTGELRNNVKGYKEKSASVQTQPASSSGDAPWSR